MKTPLALVGLTTIFLLSGCARDHAEAMTKTASRSNARAQTNLNADILSQAKELLPFSEGLAVIGLKGDEELYKRGYLKRGFINEDKKVVIPIKYDYALSFSEGLAVVGICEWLSTGIEPQFDELENYSEGVAPACIYEKWGYIDRTGASVIKPQFDYAFGFHEGKAKVLTRDPSYDGSGDGVFTGGLHGIIDKTGQYLEKPTK